MQVSNADALSNIKNEIVDILQRQQTRSRSLRRPSLSGLSRETTNSEDTAALLCERLAHLRTTGCELATAQKILESLRFPEMSTQNFEIPTACKGTFNWIFDYNTTSFRAWLESESSEGIYWISGKAGSGKSTLMKFISSHDRTRELLKEWSGEHELVVASYYFGSVGYSKQKTQEGLLQCLLFQIFRRRPDLIPLAAPDRWHADDFYSLYQDPWTRQELSIAIRNVFQHGMGHTCFAFFVDGVEEYAGDSDTIIKDLDGFAKMHNVKMAVSSRPRHAFSKAFSVPGRYLTLQDLTSDDMRTFIRDRLEENERFKELSEKDNRATSLVEDILERAQGVFLWLNLVVRDLRRGLTQGDDVAILRKRLELLPTDLEAFFRHILCSVDRVYDEYTAQALQLILEAPCPLPAVVFWYLAKTIEDNDYTTSLEVTPFARDEAVEILGTVEQCLAAWVTDLVEVSPLSEEPVNPAHESVVDLLHRTVRDFLITDETQALIRKKTSPKFHARATLCQLLVAQIKKVDINGPHWEDIFDDTVYLALHCARQCELDDQDDTDLSPYLFELDELGKHYERAKGNMSNWTELFLANKINGYKPFGGSSMLTYVTNLGLKAPLRRALDEGSLSIDELSDLLDCALRPVFRNAIPYGPEKPDIELVRLLLEAGAKINHRITAGDGVACTTWEMFLLECLTSRSGTQLEGLIPLVRLLTYHGANLRRRVRRRARSEESSTAEECLTRVCPPEDLSALEKLCETARNPKRPWVSWVTSLRLTLLRE